MTSAAWGNRRETGEYQGPHSAIANSIQHFFANPELALLALDKYESERSLLSFAEHICWPTLEPGREMIKGWVLEAMAEHLEAVADGQIKKLLINVPPGFMKSLLCSAIFTAWLWGPKNRPNTRVIGASYSGKLSLRDNRRCRNIVLSDRYQRCWGDRVKLAGDQNAVGLFENTMSGWKLATSVGGTTTGERGDVVVVDDPHNLKTVESSRQRESVLQWFSEVLPTRVTDPDNAVFIVIMQRTHEGDVSGHILETLNYDHLMLPMEFEPDHPHISRTSIHFVDRRTTEGELLWPERFSRRYLDEDLKPALRSWGEDYAIAGQLQQRPTARGGGMFKREHWRFYETDCSGRYMRPTKCTQEPAVPLPAEFDQIIITVDAAFKGDARGSRVSIQSLGKKTDDIYVLRNTTDFMGFTRTVAEIATIEDGKIVGGMLALFPGVPVVIEIAANGQAIYETLSMSIANVIGVTPMGGKESRASAVSPIVRAGRVFLPDGHAWVVDFVSEFASFPTGLKNDQVDAFTQGVLHLQGSPGLARSRMLMGHD